MPATGLDHVNIITTDLDRTKRFYRDVLGLVDGDTSSIPPGVEVHWLADPSGISVIHLLRHDPARHAEPGEGSPTGTIDHVAFNCTDYDGMIARCAELGVACRIGFAGPAFRQLFITDPNGVVLELNFRT